MPAPGKWVYKAGASGTVTLPKGARLVSIVVHSTAGGTVTIFGGDSIPVVAAVAPMHLPILGETAVAPSSSASGAQDIVFETTDSYFVEYIQVGWA